VSTTHTPADRGSGSARAAYGLTMLGVYFLVGVLFFYSGKGKLIDGDAKAPEPIKQQFEGTFVATFPGVDALWAILGALELLVFVLLVVSLLTGEFLPHRRKRILLAGLALALFTFACLSFGQTSTGNNEGTASIFSYFGATPLTAVPSPTLLRPHELLLTGLGGYQ